MVLEQRSLGSHRLLTHLLHGIPGEEEGHVRHKAVTSASRDLAPSSPRPGVRVSTSLHGTMADISSGLQVLLAPTMVPVIQLDTVFVTHIVLRGTCPTANHLRPALACAYSIAKALDLALTPTGRLKVGETRLPPIGGEKDTHAPSSPTTKHRASNPSYLPPAINDALELLFAYRGFGWDFGQGVHVPQERRPLERGPFLIATFKKFLKYFLLVDFLDSWIKLIPGVGSHSGGSMFFGLSPIPRYIISTIIHVMTGTLLLSGFEAAYASMTLVGVGLFNQSPLLWPPFLDHPFSSDSLTIFWAKRWHQLLRRTFVIFGGHPGYWLGSWVSEEVGKLGMLFGVFLASGLFHELTTYTMGKGLENNSILFFIGQAIAVLGERVWYKVTGRKVQGWIGLIWVYFCIMILAQPCGEHFPSADSPSVTAYPY